MENKVYGKQQLEIVNYTKDAAQYGSRDPRPYLDRVTVKNLSLAHDDPLYGKMLEMAIFSDSIKAFVSGLAKGGRFYADVEERVRDNERMSYSIVQAYDNGEPVSVKKKGGGGGYGKSTETVQLEIDAKFRNTALMQAVETEKIVPAGFEKADDERIIARAEKFYRWLKGGQVKQSPQKSIEQPKAPSPAVKTVAEPDKDWEKMPSGSQQKAAMADKRNSIDEIEQQLTDAATQQRYNTYELQDHLKEFYQVTEFKALNAQQKQEFIKTIKYGKVKRHKATDPRD
ncbi:MAG: hypothetical protein PHG35_07840 [Dehalococcoidales bacterium]|nr:hypothetical protein [Dehalococcoidales bacterium]